jgi:hypothetical protein
MNQPAATLYNTDFFAWTQAQASLLREEALEDLDLPNLAEELEAMGRRERRELINRLTILLLHLLKWQVQPDLRSRSWQNTIRTQRREIDLLLDDSPSLRAVLDECMIVAYPRACADATEETGLLLPSFPEACPYTPAQILDSGFLP